MFKRFLKRAGRAFETIFVLGLLRFFALLPMDVASALGARLMSAIGQRTSRHKLAIKNISLAFPELSHAEHQQIARGMWQHLGRLFAELPFLDGTKLTSRIVYTTGSEHISVKPQVIYVSGHVGQWELLNYLAYSQDRKLASVYRHINNVRLDEQLRKWREKYTNQLIRKKGESAIGMVRALTSGMSLSMLVDQRLTSGELLPFFGMPARTNIAAARLALKMQLPIIPAFVMRIKGVNFKAEILPAIEFTQSGDELEDAKNLTLAFNALLEERIRAHPEQYLWVHDRWK